MSIIDLSKHDKTDLDMGSLFAVHPHKVLFLIREDGEGGMFLDGDQEKAAAGIVKVMETQPKVKEWLAGLLEIASKK